MPAPLAHISALSLQQGEPRLQTSAVIPPPPISALLLQQKLIALQPSAMRDALLQPSAINSPPLPQILAFPLQRDVPPLQPLSACAPPPPISVSLQGRGEAPLLPSTLRDYVPLLSALLIWQGVPAGV